MRLQVDIRKELGGMTLAPAFEAEDAALGLLGASGCGKSMTLKCIAGIERPDSGRIVLDGETLFDSERGIDLPPQRRRVGYLFQNYAIFPNMTARENVECGARILPPAERRGAVEEAMRMMRVDELGSRRPALLSGGEQQRVALARLIANRPKLVMFDEPFAALDSHLRLRLQIEMKALVAERFPLSIFVTHSRDEAYRICGEIAVMDGGAITARGPTREIFSDPGSVSAAVITGVKNISAARAIAPHRLEATDWGVELETSRELRGGLCAVGVRAHSFDPEERRNAFAVRYIREVDEPFGWIAQFRAEHQRDDTEHIWLRRPEAMHDIPTKFGVAPDDVLPLYDMERPKE